MASFFGSLVGYFLLWHYLSKRDEAKMLLVALAGMFCITLSYRIFNFTSTLVSLLETLIEALALCLSYLTYHYLKKPWRYVCTVVWFVGIYWLSVPGYHYWIHYLNHGTFTGRIEAREVTDVYVLQTLDGDTVCFGDWKGKRVLLDIWSKHCGICWQKLPQVQSLYERYKDSPDVVVATAFAPLKENDWKSVEGKVRKSYTFPVFLVDREGALFRDLKIDGFPVCVVLNENTELVYRGDIEGAGKLLESLSEQ